MSMKSSRRTFVKTGAVGAAAALSQIPLVHGGVQDHKTLLVGLIGCGGRGTGAAENCLTSSPDVELIAMGDFFENRLQGSRKRLQKIKGYKVEDANCFVGLDAYKKVINSGVDMVILATPPGFRPVMFEAAINAGKHVFFEKPVGVDPVGIRRVIAAGEMAKEKGLACVSGTQRRHQKEYKATMGRILEGDIGEVVALRAYWNGGGVWTRKREPGMDDFTYQMLNWYYFTWLCGDHIVEQHIHNIDVANWAMKDVPPARAIAVGGRQVRTDPVRHGMIYDHFGVDFEYPNGVHLLSMCRHWPRSSNNVSEFIVGTKGKSNGRDKIWNHDGEELVKEKRGGNPYVQEHADLITSIRKGEPLNEAKRVAYSTLTAIMGREAAYTGKKIEWKAFLESDLDLTPKNMKPGPMPEPQVPMPGMRRKR